MPQTVTSNLKREEGAKLKFQILGGLLLAVATITMLLLAARDGEFV